MPPEPPLIQIHIPPSLSPLTVPLPTFLATHPTTTHLAASTFIFHPHPTNPTLLLLLRRAPTETGFPNKWEIPGGSTEPSDPTILHSAARETFEETGLRLTRFVRQVGDGVRFETGRGEMWLKLSFEIEVLEKGEVEVRLDPEEHQAFVWASEEDVRGEGYEVVTEEQRALMLRAFELHKGGREGVENVIDGPVGGGEVVA